MQSWLKRRLILFVISALFEDKAAMKFAKRYAKPSRLARLAGRLAGWHTLLIINLMWVTTVEVDRVTASLHTGTYGKLTLRLHRLLKSAILNEIYRSRLF